ncbi:hypothetical protein CEUSTIGMA_g10656.t1 [Chlamydomonas eustigma]|uniref:Uncharacterized protein n=1 Tax=Chlamydomonas eustigma TaxID=1157962 RepID=A0A250XKA4_9CHLO|nr:hypothetical protein CEUSTIGMA_g10656.t1 [Chlamydomonas eustigma]|eukprot:GAX83230.1 hypothetical protein CEUSTIGMA_g10656.t1 [Chlamydomonas eustigma]
MDDINDIKELVARSLERKKVLSKLRAELRAHVFLAIDEEESSTGGEGLAIKTANPNREALSSLPEGQLVVDIVHEFLEWCCMDFTLKVFEPEIGIMGGTYAVTNRGDVFRQLGLPVTVDGPVLLSLLRNRLRDSHDDDDDECAIKDSVELEGTGKAIKKPTSVKYPPQQAVQDTLIPDQGGVTAMSQRPPLPTLTSKLQPVPFTMTSTHNATSTSGISTTTLPPPRAIPPPIPSKPLALAPKKELSNDSFGEVESDEGLDGLEIVDEEEDYAFAMGNEKASQDPSHPAGALPTSLPPHMTDQGASGGGESQEMSESGLSTSSIILPGGRIRPSRASKGVIADNMNPPLAASLRSNELFQGDRSFGSSHELGSRSYGVELESSLNLSGDIPPTSKKDSQAGSLGGSREDFPTKPRGLAPLAPLSGKGLAPLAPLGAAGRPLKSSGAEDIKDELRRAGLLTLPLGDSDSVNSSLDTARLQQKQKQEGGPAAASAAGRPPPGRHVFDAELSVSNSLAEEGFGAPADPEHGGSFSMDVSRSMDMREHGISQMDRSGDLDLDTADIAETVEWD